ncbi:hypothetical protein LUZ60_013016 [Juncus effusus]|nr:hypothetical protein LUZ60_013016 [Juncus effusus]
MEKMRRDQNEKVSTPDSQKRDAYGFMVRPQHLQSYKQYAKIYQEEEEERSERWKDFFLRLSESNEISEEINENSKDLNQTSENNDLLNGSYSKSQHDKSADLIKASLCSIEQMMSHKIKTKKKIDKNESQIDSIEEEPKSEEEFVDVPLGDANEKKSGTEMTKSESNGENTFSWEEELESLVRGGVPMSLRGQLWQAFVGVKYRKTNDYYDKLSGQNFKTATESESESESESEIPSVNSTEKWKGQIEKDLPRTFPGHPALDENGRNALRRLLTAYAWHNPSVGYCQAMNFFAGLLLLLMPEENAFWTLLGIIDDYFDGYYTEEMIESQVDQLVLEELVQQRFPKLASHLNYLGVEIAWLTGPWFLSIFVNSLPWETVLRVWDVILFEGNRTMLFRTTLSLFELYGPALVTTKDAGDAITLLQSLASSTFDSSQLVLTACMGHQFVNEEKLEGLREKFRPDVMSAMEERSRDQYTWKDSKSKGLATKLYSFKHDININGKEGNDNEEDLEGYFGNSPVGSDSVPDLKDQVMWLKVELGKLLEEKRSAILRAEELETALMEMVKHDNRHALSAKVEELEEEVFELRQALKDKQEQEQAMLKVLMRVEQEQKLTEDARVAAERDAAAQKYTALVLQEKYEETLAVITEMEKRAVMAETLLKATLEYQSGQVKAQQPFNPNVAQVDQQTETSSKKMSLISKAFFSRGKSNNNAETSEGKASKQEPHKGLNEQDLN